MINFFRRVRHAAPPPKRDQFLNALAESVHIENLKWWHDPATGAPIPLTPDLKDEKIFLIVSEIVEAGEGERKNAKDDHLPHRRAAEVELADALIRMLDYVGVTGYNLDLEMHYYFDLPPISIADLQHRCQRIHIQTQSSALLRIVKTLVAVSIHEASMHPESASHTMTRAFIEIAQYAKARNFDLDGAVKEKRAYNRTRKDHTIEARLAPGGKKW